MGLFGRLFSKKPTPVSTNEDNLRPASGNAIEGPPEFIRAIELQQAYWTFNPNEQAQLEERGVENLDWPERLRLHHLNCLQRLEVGSDREARTEKCLALARRLIEPDSPYCPRPAMVWQGAPSGSNGEREPDLQGQFLNPSLTHLGCLEVCRVDDNNVPVRIDFVSFDELSGVVFARPSLIRAAKLFYGDGRGEIVMAPLLYGITWKIGNEFDRDGRMTRFVAHLDDEQFSKLGATGVGVGQQDLTIFADSGGATLFGLSSIAEISFPLDMRDPRFDEKARARGIDPEEVRRRMG
jgi:hypothetical protein